MEMTCTLCCQTFALSPEGRLPPWCPGCGADLKSGPRPVASAEPIAPSGPIAAAVPVASAVATADLSPQEEEEWKDRFGKHNVAVGILLFVWGTVVSSGPPQNGGEKVLRSHEQLGNLIDGVQLAALLSGVVLAASGVALRRGWGWGHPAAVLCAIVMVVAGFIFLAGFQSLAGGPTLEDGVARITFIRENLDMLIGLVDGLGLHWFISTRLPRPGARSYS